MHLSACHRVFDYVAALAIAAIRQPSTAKAHKDVPIRKCDRIGRGVFVVAHGKDADAVSLVAVAAPIVRRSTEELLPKERAGVYWLLVS